MKSAKAKEEVRKMLEGLPDDASLEDIQYHIYVREKVERGLQDVKEGNLLSLEQISNRPTFIPIGGFKSS